MGYVLQFGEEYTIINMAGPRRSNTGARKRKNKK